MKTLAIKIKVEDNTCEGCRFFKRLDQVALGDRCILYCALFTDEFEYTFDCPERLQECLEAEHKFRTKRKK
jgi:hypothetical protein